MDHLIPWLTLKAVPGIGNLLFKRLLDRFGTPDRVLAAPLPALTGVEGVTEPLARRISRPPGEGVFRELDRLAGSGFRMAVLTDGEYPPLLREIPDPPPFLYVSGRLIPESAHLAVVGSRHPTAYGEATAHGLGADLAEMGFVVVSGMALGIDAAAHRGALSAGGATTAVLGSGLARIYPPENRRLFHRIAETGAVISELALDAEPDRHHFPARNRIISGMALGTVVVEATRKSGSLITARLAAEQNREVFAVPGSVRSFKSAGTHQLIREGAGLIADARDIVAALPVWATTGRRDGPVQKDAVAVPPDLTPDEQRVLAALDPYGTHIDELARKIGQDAGPLGATLLALELRGLVRQEAGARFVRR